MNKTFILTLVLSLSAFGAAAETPKPAADVLFGPSGIDFAMSQAVAASLTVTGPGGYLFEAEFAANETPYVDLFDKSGTPLAAGTYNWTLSLNPQNADRERPAPAIAAENSMQSGVFTVGADGALVSPDAIESGLLKDQVIADDLIVDGSACIGFDCVNGESFGFDTLRLKENSLRINFEDTSTAPGFPTNNWSLIANDSSSGGAEKFSIQDVDGGRTPFTVEARAPNHSLYVDDGGRVGFGTSTPVAELHVVDGETPTLRLDQNGSSGFTPQTWDVAGNEANFFVRDLTNSSTLVLRIRPGAPSDALYIDADGNVGLGTSSPDGDLDVIDGGSQFVLDVGANNDNVIALTSSDGENLLTLFETVGTGAVLSMYDSGENERFRIATTGGANHFSGNLGVGCNTASADLTVNSSINAGTTTCGSGTESTMNAGDTQFVVTSSRTYKENLESVEVEGLLEKISDIDVYHYDFINGPKDRVGLIAEDFHQIFGRGSEKRLSGQEVQMALWLAVKELTQRNDALQSELDAVKALIANEAQ
ncbi:MAG: tail fiber domain-containing protein [Acidobacteriota bacterium]